MPVATLARNAAGCPRGAVTELIARPHACYVRLALAQSANCMSRASTLEARWALAPDSEDSLDYGESRHQTPSAEGRRSHLFVDGTRP